MGWSYQLLSEGHVLGFCAKKAAILAATSYVYVNTIHGFLDKLRKLWSNLQIYISTIAGMNKHFESYFRSESHFDLVCVDKG